MAKETKAAVEKPAKEKQATNNDILNAILGLTDAIKGITTRAEAPRELPKAEPVTTGAVAPSQSKFPVPTEYREIVDFVLNKKFNIDISYQADSAAFEFAVLVPEEYSNAGKPHWETYHEDRRSRVIGNALGVNGVREWVQKIYDNFGPEMKSRITFDRGQIA